MKRLNLTIIGIGGRMGTEISGLAPELGFDVTFGVSPSLSVQNDATVRRVPSVADVDSSKTDVVIDFSLPEAVDATVKWCVAHRKPLVSGVTGVSDQQKQGYADAGKTIPVLWAPNMSLGVAVLARMLQNLKSLEEFEFQIEELHHKRKKDRPSGTGLFLQERLKSALGDEVSAERLPEPLVIRGGGVFGIHRVWALGEEEMITLEHTAMNRRVFARGALRAARWLAGQAQGFYSMDDVLGT